MGRLIPNGKPWSNHSGITSWSGSFAECIWRTSSFSYPVPKFKGQPTSCDLQHFARKRAHLWLLFKSINDLICNDPLKYGPYPHSSGFEVWILGNIWQHTSEDFWGCPPLTSFSASLNWLPVGPCVAEVLTAVPWPLRSHALAANTRTFWLEPALTVFFLSMTALLSELSQVALQGLGPC